MNWPFALEVAVIAGGLTGLAIWMLTGAYGPAERTRSDEQQ